MTLLAEIKEEAAYVASPCKHRVRAALGEEWSQLVSALADPSIPIPAILRVLDKRGIVVTETTLRRWRRLAAQDML